MRKNKEERPGLRESLVLFTKALHLWRQRIPQGLFALCLDIFSAAAAPLAAMWFSAQLLDEIAGRRNAVVMMRLAVGAAVCAAVLALLRLYGSGRWEATVGHIWQKERWIYSEKYLTCDYARADDPSFDAEYYRMEELSNWNEWGLRLVIDHLTRMLSSGLQCIGSLLLCVGLFTHRIPAGSAQQWLDHPVTYGVFIAATAATALLTPVFSNRRSAVWIRLGDIITQDNRIFSFLAGTLTGDPEWAADLRTGGVADLCDRQCADMGVSATGHDSVYGRACRGSMGINLALSRAAAAAVTLTVWLFVCLRAWAGAFGVGSIAQYVGALTGLCTGFSALVVVLGELRSNAAYLRRAFAWLETPDEMYQGSLSVEKRSDRNYEVEFRNVSFRYPGSSLWTLKNVSFKFRIGQRLAVVGPNGSGKTTMIKLLCRLYDPTEGQILLNGIDIRKYSPAQYRDIFSVVFQDFRLLALPLGQNVAGRAEYDPIRAKECLRKAGLGDRLNTLPQGLDTCLYREFDGHGVEISGGEAQKIAIARALYKNAPFIILDEPTAALDPIAEAQVYEGFDSLIGDRTAVYISHRLSSCKFCDAIAVFDGGSIVQFGTHEALVNEPGRYAELWEAQAQYYR